MHRSLLIRAGRETRVSAFSLMLMLTLVFILFSCVSQAQSQGLSLSLDGASWVKVPNSTNLDANGSVTVEAWVNTMSAARQGVVEHYNNSVTTGSDGGYALRVLKNGAVAFFTLQNASTFDEVMTSGVSIDDGNWHHLAGVYNASTKMLTIYVDGNPQSGSVSGRTPPAGTGALLIGSSADSTGSFTGLIDGVRVTRAAVYTGQFTPDTHPQVLAGTIGLWTFDNQTLADSSGLGNDGVAKGTGTLSYSTNIPVSNIPPLPMVQITSPATGAIITGSSATVNVSATVTDPGTTITQVQFLVNNSVVSTVTAAPYNASIFLSQQGTYTLTAVATNSGGLSATSSPVTVTVQAGPVVSMTAPASGSTFQTPININVSANASETGATITQVQFSATNTATNVTTVIGTATISPYTIPWNNVQPGNYMLSAQATDSFGLAATSSPISISVTPGGPLPTVAITAPFNGATFDAPATITLYADAMEAGGTIASVQFSANGSPIGTATSLPFGVTFPNVPAGTYSLTAKATDSAGKTNTSGVVTIAVGSSEIPEFQGFLDAATCTTIAGWGWDSSNPNSPINIDILDGTTLIAITTANVSRPDLLDAGIGNGSHGFSVSTPSNIQTDGNTHTISARFTGTTTSLSTSPKMVNCLQIFPVASSISPKFVVLGVEYAPPGANSTVSYSNTTMEGTSTSLMNSFSSSTTVSVSVTEGFSIFGIGSSTTETASTTYTQEQDSSSSIAVTETTVKGATFPGPLSSSVGLNHDLDIIKVWINPVLQITMSDPTTIISTGFNFDSRDLVNGMDVVPIYVAWLNGHATMDPGVAGSLKRTWAGLSVDGTAPALTPADLQQILAADPFSNPGYTVNLVPGANCTADQRFCINTSIDNIDYEPPPAGGQPIVETGTIMHLTTDTQGQGGSTTFATGFSTDTMTTIDPKVANGPLPAKFGLDLKVSNTLTWMDKWSTTSTQAVGQTASFSVTGPAATDNYTGPTKFNVYQDNVYGTFMFAGVQTVSNFSLTTSASVLKVAPGTCGSITVTVTGVPGFNQSVNLDVIGLPQGQATKNFAKNPISNGSGSTTLQICTSSGPQTGPFPLTVTATSGSETHSVALKLKL